MKKMEKKVEELKSDHENSHLIGILIAIFVIITTIILLALWRRRKSVGKGILLTGLSDAGKTLIYARLLTPKIVQTYTSMRENIGNISIGNHSLKVIDIPGEERLRYTCFDRFKSTAKGLVYVIDSVTLQKDIRDVAEFLYNILCDSAIQKNVPILILCNKQDLPMAKGSTVIKTLLEKEINLLRLTKTGQLDQTDSSSSNAFLGKRGKDFEFSYLDTPIQFAECSASDEKSTSEECLVELYKWLSKIA